ncbi:MFS transporter, putative metabolite transport protein [Sulfobacillus thermosulfidooxidans DSM 9293]|uniref:MFS transporter, putative metabolite transport protein n=1 Tax=Sulfobacillus thermosulfidooxidans (strain DSM 9293 / VKM B-1269 / AT-1) TaxID=929705 RepID=A0A1W1WEK7_SULTA|nr:MFS transporter [Sulfobacillus thermosulfidooxidans]SMC04707.1 MFS transporter, putative metabolite transport protein [Sulfobacillus thermosulfidooxidans DSM 9293]
MRDSLTPRLRWATGIAVGLDGYNLTVVTASLIALTRQFHLSDFATIELALGTLFGSLLGGILAGTLTDHVGRLKVFTYDLWFFVLFSLTSALSPSFGILLVSRIFLGFAIGADYAIAPAYVAEFSPSKNRGFQLGFIWLMWPIGTTLSFVLSGIIFSVVPPLIAWRIVFALAALPAVVGIWLRKSLPESPRWLIAMGQEDQGHQLIDTYQLEPVNYSYPDPHTTSFRQSFANRWILILGTWFFLTMASYGMGLILPVMLTRSGLTGQMGAIWGTALVNVGGIVGSFVAMWHLDRIGRKSLQIVGFGIASLMLGLVAALTAASHVAPFVIILLLTVGETMSMYGPGTVTGIYPAELFPTHRRATALGVATAVSRLGAIAGALLFGLINQQGGLSPVAGVAALIMLGGSLLTWIFGTETRQRSLEDLNAPSGVFDRSEML